MGQSTKIEQTGSLNLAVRRSNVSSTMARLTALASTYQGFVASSETQSGAGGATGTITLQVPVNDFSVVLQQAERYGKASNVSTKATDVTGQYVDLQARLTALEASRQQYLAILTKATTIGDILSVQEQLDAIQTQIEQLQGQLQVLTSQTSYSTLTLTVGAGTPAPKPGPLPESGLVQAWHSSVGGFVAGVEGVVRLAGPFLFALLCLAIVAVGGRARVASLSASSALSGQRPMAAAKGRPGIVITPTMPLGVTSSLTAIGPPARTTIGSSPTLVSAEPDTTSTGPGLQRARSDHMLVARGDRVAR